jgi:hypothetical protein
MITGIDVGVDPLVPQISRAGALSTTLAGTRSWVEPDASSLLRLPLTHSSAPPLADQVGRLGPGIHTGDKPKPSSPPVSRTPKLGGQTKKLNIDPAKSLSIASSRHLAANSNKDGHVKTELITCVSVTRPPHHRSVPSLRLWFTPYRLGYPDYVDFPLPWTPKESKVAGPITDFWVPDNTPRTSPLKLQPRGPQPEGKSKRSHQVI